MVWAVSSTSGPTWQAGSTAAEFYDLAGSVADFPETGVAAATTATPNQVWSTGSTLGGSWQAATTSAPITFGLWQYTAYRAGESCELGVIGADGVFQIVWSPVNDPLNAAAVTLTVTSTDLDVNGTGRVFVTAQRGTVRYGQQGWLFLIQGELTTGMSVTLLPEPNKQYVVLAAPLVAPEFGVSAIPDLAAGDMLIWWNALPAGTVEIFPNRSFITDDTVLTFVVEAHLAGEGYTNTETQDIDFGADPNLTGAVTDLTEIVAGSIGYIPTGNAVAGNVADLFEIVSGTATLSGFSEWVSPVPLATHLGQVLADQTDIQYAFLPGHVLHSSNAIVVRSNGTTNAQGYFRAQNISYPAGQPVTLLMRWIEGGRDRFVILYTQLAVQG